LDLAHGGRKTEGCIVTGLYSVLPRIKNEGTFVPSPLKMRGHFQNLRDIKVYVLIV